MEIKTVGSQPSAKGPSEWFTGKSAIERLNNYSVKTQAVVLRGLRSEKSPQNRSDFW